MLRTEHQELMNQDYTHLLRQFMQRVGVSSFRALAEASGISEKQIRQLRRGNIAQMRIEPLLKLSQVLQMPLAELVKCFQSSPEVIALAVVPFTQPESSQGGVGQVELADLTQEYARLQEKLEQQRENLQQEFQQTSLQVLEPLLLQLPTAAYAAQQNPQAPAVRLLPLLRPLDQLLQTWGIEPIASVGAEMAFDPQLHQLMEGNAEAGDRVRVRYTGYRQGDKLLYRARVSPIKD